MPMNIINLLVETSVSRSTIVRPLPRDELVTDLPELVLENVIESVGDIDIGRCMLSFASGRPLPMDDGLNLGDLVDWKSSADGLDAEVNENTNGTDYLRLRLTPHLPGGKGGFGSQLRAAGGRMSSQPTNNSACRDLSGRRLRSIQEAEELARYERERPKREREEKKRRRERLEGKIRTVEREEEQGAVGAGRRMEVGKWEEEREGLVERVRSSVKEALREAKLAKQNSSERDSTSPGEEDEQDDVGEGSSSAKVTRPVPAPKAVQKKPIAFAGWDDEDEDEDDSEEEDEEEEEEPAAKKWKKDAKGKGKAKA
ncbi:hypothetical protein SAICODRAFT_27321 [Saitoella complicata NRRL Y-17804]|uniref:uncharacterized protein n=1 Tax=Saitoella complicata (strain BCRC 22490 / CBS 7301 / JCM 7358 / NBRC 10748 / NRRL Y-17804) TaxID=698492 RepID=UPI0008674BEC|nr:uncharacterized protein SAICODRAFT_27321 [Saitoella complicata NRRL Y-17804]ODQ50650.1 hypothetical protein SAICODRAFT_27321 [Saitoella complicata NRRL Y-17804]